MYTLTLRRGADRRSRRGHLWIFSNELQDLRTVPPPGADVRILDAAGHLVGSGTFHPHTLIAVRLHALGQEIPLDSELLDRRLQEAVAMREGVLLTGGSRACRLVNAEGDFLPGLIVDRYEDILSVQCLTAAMDLRSQWVLEVLTERLRPAGILLRNDAPSRNLEGLPEQVIVARGEVPGTVLIRLDELRFRVDPTRGQKTGFYFDQRQNYGLIRSFCRGARVLDAFCFTGPWALHAASWGAHEVLGIDSSEPVLELARQNAEENGLADVRFRRGEVIDALKEFADQKRLFEVIVLDPPAYAKSRKQAGSALKGHLNLHKWALRCVAPGGTLVTCCCSSYIESERFLESLVLASGHTGRTLRVLAARGQGIDHPWIPAMPETAYLKVVQVHCLA